MSEVWYSSKHIGKLKRKHKEHFNILTHINGSWSLVCNPLGGVSAEDS